jgi:hypothetical protein
MRPSKWKRKLYRRDLYWSYRRCGLYAILHAIFNGGASSLIVGILLALKEVVP